MIGYEIEYFSFLFIAVLFSAGNVKKNVFTVFTVPIVTIDGFNNRNRTGFLVSVRSVLRNVTEVIFFDIGVQHFHKI